MASRISTQALLSYRENIIKPSKRKNFYSPFFHNQVQDSLLKHIYIKTNKKSPLFSGLFSRKDKTTRPATPSLSIGGQESMYAPNGDAIYVPHSKRSPLKSLLTWNKHPQISNPTPIDPQQVESREPRLAPAPPVSNPQQSTQVDLFSFLPNEPQHPYGNITDVQKNKNAQWFKDRSHQGLSLQVPKNDGYTTEMDFSPLTPIDNSQNNPYKWQKQDAYRISPDGQQLFDPETNTIFENVNGVWSNGKTYNPGNSSG